MEKKRLRFGVICDSINVYGWQLNCLKKMLEMDDVEASLMILVKNKQLQKEDEKKTLRYFNPAKTTSLTSLVNNIKIIGCDLVRIKTGEDHLSKEDLEKIYGYDLDFILNISSINVSGDILTLPRFGVWVFQHGSDLPHYIWCLENNEPVTFAALHKLSNQNKHIILKKGCFSTIKDSYRENREHITSVISNWPALVCRDILNDNTAYMKECEVPTSPSNFVDLTFKNMGKFFVKLLKNKGQKIFSKLFSYEYWNIGIVPKPIHEFLNDSNLNINWLVQKKDLYYADPFAYQDEEGLHILMEELDYRVVKGFISGVNVKQKTAMDTASFNQAVMKFPCHMSYPFILEHNKHIYCIPETSEAKEASIYKLNKSNNEWKKVKTLLEDFHAVDSTIVKYGEYWWLFCTKSFSTVQSHNNELHIFYADDLFGEWQPHVLNPVKIDIRSSRPAGTPFIHEGKLFRPAQDCSKTYGGRIVLNKIKTLTIFQFEEEPVCYLEPQNNSLYPDGVHTISSAGGITILDGKRFDYSLFHFFRKLYKYRPVNLEKVKSDQFKTGEIGIQKRLLRSQIQEQIKQVKQH
ncbi:glucosamine inositolphosphorylceramide transferase family protein [Bacillus sp. UNC438CL73TsuS30]|uniref:glucosamine inositolphosphorylceramide transferase family protein n=1 Tax=Bacillus sp. UNC438CL73TsuS30 TaxID=1340434 RepID=UPI00047EA0C2|nr:hypothetical protein [Bacillus sp. UNC438CL73TsuS30]